MKNLNLSRYSFIFIIPLITLIASYLFRAASGPFWQYGDPPYNYLFNALQILKGHPPTDFAHPGTPLQVLIALTIYILNLGHPAGEAVTNALINPEFYLRAVYTLLTIGIFLTSVLLAAYVYRKTNDKIAALLTQLMPLSFLLMPSFDNGSFPVLPVLANLSSEYVFIIVMNLFNLFLIRLYFSENRSQELRNVLVLALVCGFGLAIKINFFIILLSALILTPIRQKLFFLIICALSFIFCTLPILGKYPQLLHYISDMLEHSSRYGMGPKKFIDWKLFSFYFSFMLRIDWFFVYSAFGLWIWSSIKIIRNRQDRGACYIWALSFCCLLQILTTAKLFSFHYLLPAFCLFSTLFPLFYISQITKYKLLKPLFAGFILIFISVCAFYAVPYYQKLLVLSQDIRQFNDTVNEKYPQCTIIPATTVDIVLFLNEQAALHWACGYNHRLESEDLLSLYPHSYYFFSEEVTSPDPSVESYGIWDFKQRIWGDDIISGSSCPIFIKYASDLSNYPYQVQLLERSKYLNAYLLISSTEKEANALFEQSMDSLKKGDYQQAMILGLKSRQLNYEPRGQIEYFLMIIYHELLKSRGEVK